MKDWAPKERRNAYLAIIHLLILYGLDEQNTLFTLLCTMVIFLSQLFIFNYLLHVNLF